MATITYIIPITEVTLDKNLVFVAEHERDLPHADTIAGRACSSWRSIRFDQIVNSNPVIAGGVDRAPMVAKVGRDGSLSLVISVVANRGFRLSERRRNAIFEELDAQMSDGWGESFFGEGNPMSDDEDNRFCVETALKQA